MSELGCRAEPPHHGVAAWSSGPGRLSPLTTCTECNRCSIEIKPRRQTFVPHPGAAARNNSSARLPEPRPRFHSGPSSTLVEGAGGSRFRERSSAATHSRSAGKTPSSTKTTGTPYSRRPNHRATNARCTAPLCSAKLAHESPAAGTTPSSSTTQMPPHFVDDFRAATSLPTREAHRLTPNTLPHATTPRHCLATRPTATLSRRSQPRVHSRHALPRHHARRSLPADHLAMMPTGSSRLESTSLHSKPSNRNSALQQNDAKASTQQIAQSPTLPSRDD
jgi:hypothetical protein